MGNLLKMHFILRIYGNLIQKIIHRNGELEIKLNLGD
nr:MAG TPA: hypothetical protein [Caudoviricetes sp.]